MTGGRRTAAHSAERGSYRDAAVTHLPAHSSRTPPPHLRLQQQLSNSLRVLLAQRPDGISLNEARRSCPLLLDPELLKDQPSVRHLLLSMPAVVSLKGFGVQTRLFPPPENI